MIAIDDADVAWAARTLNCTFGEPHAKFLKADSSCDLHACPGSGKTTLLVAKLAILARKWSWRDRGILVISHTNVARREVEQRLEKEPAAARLLIYPHFIGTIQGFVDRFLALPFLRDVGIGGAPIEDPRVHDDAFAARAEKLFFSPSGWRNYSNARNWLSRKHNEGRGTITTLFYKGPAASLATEEGRIPAAHTPTARQLRALKEQLSREGIFRYDDMFAFASASLNEHAFLRAALRHRFPWVFIDEMQDTSLDQAALLDDIFSASNVTVAKIGDANQAIYSEAADETKQQSLPWVNAIDLPQSQRLAPKLAELVSPLAAVHPIRIVGNTTRKDRTHTIFLFDDVTISTVLSAFGDLILEEWDGAPPIDLVAKAVGFRRRPPEKRQIPACLGDYWPDYDAHPADDRARHQSLVVDVRHARRLVDSSKEYFAAHRAVTAALAHLLGLHEGCLVTRRQLEDRCRNAILDPRLLKRVIAALLLGDYVADAASWEKLSRFLRKSLVPGTTKPDVDNYLAWDMETVSPSTAKRVNHVFVHRAKDKTVSIELATIHAVKGETHDATLVLETHVHEHDMQLALPILLGRTAALARTRVIGHVKRLFVAATRPKELLCLALHRTHATEDELRQLHGLGWTIRTLT